MNVGVSIIEDVEVSRDGDGHLKVSWRVDGACDHVHVAWGRSADGLDHEHVMTVEAPLGEARLADDGLADGRVYVSIAPADGQSDGPGATIAAERRIGMNGPVNFRDLGGYRSSSGATVRWGRVFRSDALLLDDEDLVAFGGLGIRTVYDLRSDMERDVNPNRLPEVDGPDVVIVPLVRQDPDDSPLARFDLSDGENFLAQLYEHSLEQLAPNFGVVLTGLSRQEDLPAVFHCAAGKDRTGMVAAVLLSVLGVSLEDILDDYELTGRFRTSDHVHASMQRLRANGDLPPEVIAGILRSPRWAMQSALAAVAGRYGDFDGYLTGPGGTPADVPGRLREILLRP
ncbi:MAG: tyrosine-protein phosphatase [Actinomycetota bacterium]|nr:tyrosine-protein phosphatase [Actinomycetota bacterium]